jgi:protein O-mannosyl-transferase
MSRPASRAAPVALAVLSALVFAPSLLGGFLDWDDQINFLENPHYRGLGWRELRWMLTANVMGHWIPVTWLTFGVDYSLWGMRPFGYHLTNVVLHATSAALFYLVARRLLGLALPSSSRPGQSLGATAAALFFAVHPLRVESVAWITERRDLTSGLFFLLTVLAYLKAHERPPEVRRGWQGAALIFAALALASKSIVMGLPLVLVVLDVYPLRRLGPTLRDWTHASARPVWLEKIPFALLAVATAAAAFHFQRSSGYLTQADPLARLATFFYNIGFHAWKTFVPLNLSPVYEMPRRLHPLEAPYLPIAIAVLAISVAVWLARRRWPAGLAIWVFYLVMLGPVTGLVHTGYHLGADRNTYLPCAGFALLVGGLVIAAVEAARRGAIGRPVATLAAALVLFWLAGLAVAASVQTRVWRDPETLWRYAITIDPRCSICLHNLGIITSQRGDRGEAMTLFDRALALRPERSEFYSNYGVLLLQMGRRAEGIEKLRYRLAHEPRDVGARTNLGIALIEDGRPAEAIAELEEALRVRPDSARALTSLGRALLTDGRVGPAVTLFERAIGVHPLDPVARLGLARAYRARGDRAAAQQQLVVLSQLDPRLAGQVEHEFR